MAKIKIWYFSNYKTGWLTAVPVETQPFYWIFYNFMGFWIQNNQQIRLPGVACWWKSCLKKACKFQDFSIWPPSGHFLQNLISAIYFSSENNPLVEVSATLTNAFLLLKITSSFQAAFPSASNSRQPNLLIVLDSESHELVKNAIKRLSFDWDGG